MSYIWETTHGLVLLVDAASETASVAVKISDSDFAAGGLGIHCFRV